MIYFAAALACFALVGHIYVTRQREAKTRRQIRELKESVAHLTIAEQNRQSIRITNRGRKAYPEGITSLIKDSMDNLQKDVRR